MCFSGDDYEYGEWPAGHFKDVLFLVFTTLLKQARLRPQPGNAIAPEAPGMTWRLLTSRETLKFDGWKTGRRFFPFRENAYFQVRTVSFRHLSDVSRCHFKSLCCLQRAGKNTNKTRSMFHWRKFSMFISVPWTSKIPKIPGAKVFGTPKNLLRRMMFRDSDEKSSKGVWMCRGMKFVVSDRFFRRFFSCQTVHRYHRHPKPHYYETIFYFRGDV